jgi:hypothetical protein
LSLGFGDNVSAAEGQFGLVGGCGLCVGDDRVLRSRVVSILLTNHAHDVTVGEVAVKRRVSTDLARCKSRRSVSSVVEVAEGNRAHVRDVGRDDGGSLAETALADGIVSAEITTGTISGHIPICSGCTVLEDSGVGEISNARVHVSLLLHCVKICARVTYCGNLNLAKVLWRGDELR